MIYVCVLNRGGKGVYSPADQLEQAPSELDIRQQVKQVGGTWNPQLRVWELRHNRLWL